MVASDRNGTVLNAVRLIPCDALQNMRLRSSGNYVRSPVLLDLEGIKSIRTSEGAIKYLFISTCCCNRLNSLGFVPWGTNCRADSILTAFDECDGESSATHCQEIIQNN